MNLLRTFAPFALSMMLAACSGGDSPAAPKVASAATTAATPAPGASAAEVAAASTPAPTTPVPDATVPATVPAAAPSPEPTAAANPAASAGDPTYTVQCAAGATAAEQCQVDKDTYIGWRTFSSQCQVCHGGSALGSTFAPNLLDRFHQRVDHARFVEVVTNGFRGQVGAMPAWKGNPNVMPHVDQLYRYLKARADDVLPPGRPERKP